MLQKTYVKEISNSTNIDKEVVRKILKEFFLTIKDEFIETDNDRERYAIRCFGTFQKSKYTSIRDGKRSIKNTIRFKISKEFRDIMNS